MTAIPTNTFQGAESILLQYADKSDIGSNDGLHLAIVTALQTTIPTITIVTADQAMKAVCAKLQLPVYDPEIN